MKYCVRTMFALSLIAFGLTVIVGFHNSAKAEVIQPVKPIKPSFRIIQGKSVGAQETRQNSDAVRIWKLISDTKDIGILDRFIKQFPATDQATLALNRRELLVRETVELDKDKKKPAKRAVNGIKRPDLTREIQAELIRLGCNPGPSDGKWGRQSSEAATRFSKYSDLVVETGYPNEALLAGVKAIEGKICPVQCGVKFNRVENRCVAKICSGNQKLSSRGICYTPKVTKTCGPGQRLSSKGRCYTPKAAKTCRRGERLSSRGVCYTPKPIRKKVTTPRKPVKPKTNQCSWCTIKSGAEVYACGARLSSMRASGNCN